MIIAVASGKGGTGKTTVAVNLALSLSNVQVLDCDVEEPNSHIFLNPMIEEIKPAYTLVPTTFIVGKFPHSDSFIESFSTDSTIKQEQTKQYFPCSQDSFLSISTIVYHLVCSR